MKDTTVTIIVERYEPEPAPAGKRRFVIADAELLPQGCSRDAWGRYVPAAPASASAPPGLAQALDGIAQDVWFGGMWGTIAGELDKLTGRKDTSTDRARMAVTRWVQRHPEWQRLNAAGKPQFNLTKIAAAMTGR